MSLAMRLLQRALLAAIALSAVYVGICLQMLSRLDGLRLIAQYTAQPYSAQSPIAFPVARWVTDMHWALLGRDEIAAASHDSNRHIKYLSDRIAEARSQHEPMDFDRADKLLVELVCAKRDDRRAVRDMDVYQSRWRSEPLAAAMQTCGLPLGTRRRSGSR